MNSIRLKRQLLLALFIVINSFLLAQPVSQTFNASGSYTIPAGYTATIKVEAWGGGGGGGGDRYGDDGAGGGGGAYASKTLSNLAAGTYTITVGAGGAGAVRNLVNGPSTAAQNGGNSFFGANLVVANGGRAGGGEAGGAGGAASTGAGYTSWSGGTGGKTNTAWNTPLFGGGGGGSAKTTGAGGNGSMPSTEGGEGGTGEGKGGKGGFGSNNPASGALPGGGGGGKANTQITSGNGAPGRVIITVTGYITLPVKFGPISAKITGNEILVQFTTLEETNNSHFGIQLSENGVDFETVAIIKSRHANNTYTGSTAYNITIDPTGKATLAFTIAVLVGLCTPRSRKKILYLMVLIHVTIYLLTISCNKGRENITTMENRQAYLRIQQVDVNGDSTCSKVIRIVKE